MSGRPNIVYIHAHDTGRHISPYGSGFYTPKLQELASEGVLFKNNFCVSPGCSASRASLLTGTYPHQNGMIGLIHRGFILRDYKEHLIHSLKPLGYHAALSGIQHVAMAKGNIQGWERVGYDECLSDMDDAHINAIKFLEQPHSKPFFLSVGFFENLRTLPPVDDNICDPRYCSPPPCIPDTPETRRETAQYAASVYNFDQKVGSILEALDRAGLVENTLVICTTTNGLSFPNMKGTLLDAGVGAFLIMRGPGGFSGGRVVSEMTSHLDIYPTICDLLQIEQPERLEGKSLLPLLDSNHGRHHEKLFFQLNYHASYEPTRAVRTSRYKYIRRYVPQEKVIPANCDDGDTKQLFINAGWLNTPVPREQLYDLLLDPNETHNLAYSERHMAIIAEMRKNLETWMDDKQDPMKFGYMAPPKGAKVNAEFHLSPEEYPLENA